MRTFFVTLSFIFICVTFTQNSAFSQAGVDEHSIKFQSNLSATMVGEDGAIMITSDGGSNWTEQSSGITNALYGNAIVDQNISFAVGENGIFLKTTDGGNNWSLINVGTYENLKKIVVVAASVVICGENGTILVSHDMGASWTKPSQITTNNLNYVTKAGQNLIIVGSGSAILNSTDNGDTWTQIPFIYGSNNFNSIGAIDENNFTIVGDGYTLIRTTDAGSSWIGIGTNPGNINLNEVTFFDALNGVIVGNKGVVLNTTDAGSSWQQADVETVSASPVSRNLLAVSFSSVKNGITIGENGVHFYTKDGGKTWTDLAPGPLKSPVTAAVKNSKVTLNQNFPNPFNPSTVIAYNLPFDASVTIKIYDMLGKEVKTLVNGYQTEGNYSVRFDGSNLSSGIYFYVLKAYHNSIGFSKTMRMILTK